VNGTTNKFREAEELASAFIEGRRRSDDCPHLNQLVEQVREGTLSRDEFVEIIDFHLKENERRERLKEVI
jgi:hypothetical protein